MMKLLVVLALVAVATAKPLDDEWEQFKKVCLYAPVQCVNKKQFLELCSCTFDSIYILIYSFLFADLWQDLPE